jgi:hypothetical protein
MPSASRPDHARPARPFLRTLALVVISLLAVVATSLTSMPSASSAVLSAPTVKVSGNTLVTGTGAPIRLLGVGRSGTEYACIQGWGIFSGPSDATSIAAIASWKTNAVRVPLNEDCWLGINGVSPTFGGLAYRTAIKNYVTLLHQAGLIAVLDLHWSAPGTRPADTQQVMADADHAVAFWTSVATTFKADRSVVFDLFNEPHDITWSCWRDGCTTAEGWKAVGMQTLVNTVRNAGATTQPLILAGNHWSSDLSQWLTYKPVDKYKGLVAGFHVYDYTGCATRACWDSTIAPVAAKVPVVTGEVGEWDCTGAFLDQYLPWADGAGVSYLGWSWLVNAEDCKTPLVSDYAGTPTAFGLSLKNHLAGLAGGSTGVRIAVV